MDNVEQENYIICNGNKVLVEWPMVDTSTYNLPAPGRGSNIPKMIVCHWDATYSSDHCHQILKKRNLSIHFSVDNDGTIYQMCDTFRSAQHASVYNRRSIGIEISNAVYPLSHQKWYTSHGFKFRPIVSSKKLNGKKYPDFLGFYPEQILALKALINSLCFYYEIPKNIPTDEHGNYLEKYLGAKIMKNFCGICGHLHLNSNKWDPLGLDLNFLI